MKGSARILALALVGCSLLRAEPAVLELKTPCPPVSGESSLHTGPDGTVYLTYAGPGLQSGERALWLAKLAPSSIRWSEPQCIISTPLLMENWADFATLTVGTDGTLWAQWFQNREAGQRGYSGWFARSTDGGKSWSAAQPLGQEFVSLAPMSGGRVMAVWLESARPPRPPLPPGQTRPARDPNSPRPARDPNAPYAPSMRLAARLLGPDGNTLQDWVVDPDVCTCCQTTLVLLPNDRLLVSYRGHTPAEIRDNWYARFEEGTWSAPVLLHADGWMIPGCPVNGPAADASGENTAIAWFTAANGIARVQGKFSRDGGRTFGPAVPLDLGSSMGRIDLIMLPEGTALVSSLEAKSVQNTAGIYLRTFSADGMVSHPLLVAATTQARASGFPRMALRPDGSVVLAYTEDSAGGQVRTLLISTLPRPTEPTTPEPPRFFNLTQLEWCETSDRHELPPLSTTKRAQARTLAQLNPLQLCLGLVGLLLIARRSNERSHRSKPNDN